MKKSFLGLAALACAFAGMAVGLIGANNVKTVSAVDVDDTHTWGIIGSFSGNNWDSDVATSAAYDATTGTKTLVYNYFTEGTTFKIRADRAYTVALDSNVLTQERTGGNVYFEDDGTTNKNIKVKTGYGGRFVFVLSGNLYIFDDKSFGVHVSYYPYVVTEYAVVGGTKEATAFTTEGALSSTAFTPKDAHRTGYTFGGWFTNEACTTGYTDTTLTGDTTLYAKYTKCTESRNVYFKSANWSKVYVYTFGQSEAMGAFPGTDISAASVANLTFNGAGLYATWVYESGDDHIIFSDGTSTNKTADLSLVEGGYYSTALAQGNVVLGGAASVAMEWAASVAASTNASACNMAKTEASSIVTDYGNVTDTDAKTILNNATLYTWADAARVNKTNVKFLDMYPLIQQQANKNSAVVPVVKTDSDSMPFMLIAFGLVALGGCVSYLLLRKRNED